MGVELILMLIVVIVVIGIDSIYSYLSNKKTNIKVEVVKNDVESIKNEIKTYIGESRENQKQLAKDNKLILNESLHALRNIKDLKGLIPIIDSIEKRIATIEEEKCKQK